MKKTVLAFGEVLWDLLPTETILGGAVCNFAYRVNSLGDRAIVISRLGRDELGRKAFDRVSSLGLATEHLQWDAHYPTGTVPVTFDENSNPDFVIIPNVAYDHIEMTHALREVASTADCLCFGTLSQRTDKTRQTLMQLIELADKSIKLLDINLRRDCYSLETVTYSLEKADILKLNEDELYRVAEMLNAAGYSVKNGNPFGVCEDIMEKWSLKYCVVTLGAEGAFAISDRRERVYDPGYRIKLVDSLGAGDAFTAGFAYCILRDLPLDEACKLGNILGAITSTQAGATAPITRDDIERFKGEPVDRIFDEEISQIMDS